MSAWVGLEYLKLGRTLDGIDCYGLYAAIALDRLGIVVPDPYCTVASAVRHSPISAMASSFRAVTEPAEGDLILMRSRGHLIHVGYCVNAKYMLHIEAGTTSTCEDWTSGHVKPRIEGLYRYVGS